MKKLVVAALLLMPLLRAQTGVVEGRVTDTVSKAGIAGVDIRVWTRDATRYQTSTDAGGAFRVGGLKDGVYTTQAMNLGFTQYRDELIVARAGDTLAVMTPTALQELARTAAAVHEARLEEQQLRDGLGLVIFGSLQAFGPADVQPLSMESVSVLRKAL